MTSTLYFYKLPINLLDKNFVLESIETYLATLTPLTKTKFQYQRFDLEKTIKINTSQDYQLNNVAINKYNYLKVTTLDSNNNTATYYYFIKKARQVSESTIELSLEMDTLNTFNFSSTASNKTYTLSNKSLIQREHKDRMVKLPISFATRDSTVQEQTAHSELENWNHYGNVSDKQVNLLLNLSGIIQYMTNHSINSLRLDFTQYNDSYLQCDQDKYSELIEIQISRILNKLYLIKSDGFITLDINEINYCVVVIPPNSELDFDFIDYAGDWTEFINIALNEWQSVTIQENKYKRVIDYYQEGLSTFLFKKSEEELLDDDGHNQWYVLYSSANAVAGTESVSSVKYVNPVQIRFYSDNGYAISTVSASEVTLLATSPLIPRWTNSPERMTYLQETASTLGDIYVKIGGTTYDFHDYKRLYFVRENNNDLTFRIVSITKRDNTVVELSNVDQITFYGINEIEVDGYWNNSGIININSGSSSFSGTADKWKDLDLTDDRFIKAFAFPYCPCEFMVGKDSFEQLPAGFTFNADNFIQLSNTQKYEFKYQKEFKVASPLHNINLFDPVIGYAKARNIKYESKLFHSDYYQPKFVYDSFSFMFALETLDIDSVNDSYLELDSKFYVTYVVSRNVQSKFLFIFDEYYLVRATQDYDNVLTIERNNEKALYNNAYINYVRSGGYSYDQKKASSQNAVNGVTTALSIVGSVASFGGAVATGNPMLAVSGVGLAVGGITGIMRSVHTAQEQDRAIAQKVNQAVLQGSTVQGSEDIDILTAFSGNKAKLVYYELSDIMKNAMWDLFHYCGYATHEQKVPSVDTRIYFNFVQGEIILKDYTFNDDIANRIIQKWREGVTFMHLVNSTYDFNQEYENFETSLM